MRTQDRIDDILARFPGPVTLHPSRRRWSLVLLLSAGFTAGGVWMASEDRLGWFVAAFFGACTVAAAIALLPGASALKLDHEGFESTALFRRGTVRWRNASGFTVARVPTTSEVLVVFDDATLGGRTVAKVNVRLMGRNASLPDTYGLPAEALAALMARWHERATAS